MRPEDSAEFQQQVVARHELIPAVADGTRQTFEQLKTIYAYGVLCYDIFTVVHDHALLVFEQALRDRGHLPAGRRRHRADVPAGRCGVRPDCGTFFP